MPCSSFRFVFLSLSPLSLSSHTPFLPFLVRRKDKVVSDICPLTFVSGAAPIMWVSLFPPPFPSTGACSGGSSKQSANDIGSPPLVTSCVPDMILPWVSVYLMETRLAVDCMMGRWCWKHFYRSSECTTRWFPCVYMTEWGLVRQSQRYKSLFSLTLFFHLADAWCFIK